MRNVRTLSRAVFSGSDLLGAVLDYVPRFYWSLGTYYVTDVKVTELTMIGSSARARVTSVCPCAAPAVVSREPA
jgi:hypothetical protein